MRGTPRRLMKNITKKRIELERKLLFSYQNRMIKLEELILSKVTDNEIDNFIATQYLIHKGDETIIYELNLIKKIEEEMKTKFEYLESYASGR